MESKTTVGIDYLVKKTDFLTMESKTTSDIHSLPDEIILLILKQTSHSDCNSFMRTCKRYNDLLKSSQGLWRDIYKKTVGKEVYKVTTKHSEGNWFSDLRRYLCLRQTLINILIDMSQEYFSNMQCGLNNVKHVFAIALSSNTNYFYTVSILQNFIKRANKLVSTYETERPYTLTEIHYAKMGLRYLIQVYLSIKWTNNNLPEQLPPEASLIFFMQWIDPLNMHSEDDFNGLIKGMIYDVDKELLKAKDGSRKPGEETYNTCVNGFYRELDVLMAISYYMYKRRRMVLVEAFNDDTLDIVKTIKSNSGSGVCLGAIFNAIARGFGITSCKLVYFAHHLFLIWRSQRPEGGYNRESCFNLENGELRPVGRCPYSASSIGQEYEYSPNTFISFVIMSYISSIGHCNDWHGNNARHLMDFLSGNTLSEFATYIPYLNLEIKNMNVPFNMEYLHEEQMKCILSALALNEAGAPPDDANLEVHSNMYCGLYNNVVKRRPSTLLYSIGLICFHKEYNYVCVIRGWEMERPNNGPSEDGHPYYQVVAVDQSERYIAQENLVVVRNPSRIFHLEEVISIEFSHFNGFFYVPNVEKQALYPDDLSISHMYASQKTSIHSLQPK